MVAMRPAARARQSGFTYIGVLILVAIMGITAAATGELWRTESRREAEAQLLFVGNQYRQAITGYYEQSPGQKRSFPMRLDDLLRDPRVPGTKRYLRKLFADPVTGGEEWGLVKGPAGEILGVFSLSEQTPIKKSNFGVRDARLEDRQKYSEWVFMYTPGRSSPIASPQPAKPRQDGTRVPR
jgi:type II secretory pathway pseudopilin PulG